MATNDNRSAIVLCGGQSVRMGRSKAWLPFGPETMLQRIVRVLSDVTPRIVVVAGIGQDLPALPPQVQLVRDHRPNRGPLEGLAAGLAVLDDANVAYLTGCDVPGIQTHFVEFMFDQMDKHDIAVPQDNEHLHPLAAVYRRTVLSEVLQLLSEDRLKPRFLFERVMTKYVSTNELRLVDASLESLDNLNRPEDYRRALRDHGFADG